MNKLRMIDAHAHLNFEAFKEDRDEIIRDCLREGVGMINVGASFESSRVAAEIGNGYSRGVWTSVGLHPIHVWDEDFSKEAMQDLITNNERVVAIGETGLDYFHLKSDKGKMKEEGADVEKTERKQREVFLKHLDLARTTDLPLILHCRHHKDFDAHYDLIEALEEFSTQNTEYVLKGTMHCYTGNADLAQVYLKLGLYLGFTGVITFSKEYEEVIASVPLERMLIETDAPYLSPEPKRGERNVPQNVKYVGEKIAEIKGVELEEVFAVTKENTADLFSLN